MSLKGKVYHRPAIKALIRDVENYFAKNAQPLVVMRHAPERNEGQQAKLHCLIREIAGAVGVTSEYLKQEVLKRDCDGVFPFWPQIEERNLHGEKIMVPKSESKLRKAEETEVIDRLYALGAEWGVEFKDAA